MVAWYVWGIDFKWYNAPSTRRQLALNIDFAADLAIAFALKSAFGEKNPMLSPSSTFHEGPAKEVKEGEAT